MTGDVHIKVEANGQLDIFVVADDGLANFLDGRDVDAFFSEKGVSSLDRSIDLRSTPDRVHVVIMNTGVRPLMVYYEVR